jgi:pimeloyl-ACP methyl ester carboxylesterase
MPLARINGVNIFWEATGDSSDSLVLVHGSWVDHHSWDSVVTGLAKNFRVITYDRRGHSQSERPAGQGRVREDVSDLAALINHLELGETHIAGNSFGAIITLKLAAQEPQLFKTMFIHEPPLFTILEGESKTEKTLGIALEKIGGVVNLLKEGKNVEGAELFVETIAFGPGDWKKLPPQLQQTFIYNAQTWLDEISDDESLRIDLTELKNFYRPVFLSKGEMSPPFFSVVIDKLSAALPNIQTKTFASAGHVPHLSHPTEYIKAVTEFIFSQRN